MKIYVDGYTSAMYIQRVRGTNKKNKMNKNKNTYKFKLGDKVKSASDSCDVTMMKATWVAVIHEVKGENENGGCFETLGKWYPIENKDGNVHPLWSDHNPNEKPSLRQLWGSHLVTN